MISLNSGGQLNPNTRVSLDVRLSNASVKLTEDAQKWGGGTLTLVDVIGTLGWRLLLPDHGYVSFEGGLGVTVLGGARNVAPFHEASRAIPVAEATIAYDLPFTFSRATTALLVRSSFLRIGGKNADDAVQAPGYVRRVSVGVRVSR